MLEFAAIRMAFAKLGMSGESLIWMVYSHQTGRESDFSGQGGWDYTVMIF